MTSHGARGERPRACGTVFARGLRQLHTPRAALKHVHAHSCDLPVTFAIRTYANNSDTDFVKRESGQVLCNISTVQTRFMQHLLPRKKRNVNAQARPILTRHPYSGRDSRSSADIMTTWDKSLCLVPLSACQFLHIRILLVKNSIKKL